MKEMKKFLLMLFVFAVPMALATGCSDDDKDDDPTLAEEVQGTYNGTVKVDVTTPGGATVRQENPGGNDGDGEGEIKESIKVTLTKTADTEVKMAIGDLTILGFTAKIDDLEGVKLTGKLGEVAIDQKVKTKINISGEGDFPIEIPDGGLELEVNLKGSVKEGKNLSLSVNIPLLSVIVKSIDITATK